MKQSFFLVLVGVALFVGNSFADELSVPKITPLTTTSDEHFHENAMALGIENANLMNITGHPNYWLNNTLLTWRWQLDDVGNDDWRRGNTEWVTSAYYENVLSGVEHHFEGVLMGPRYNFVQKGWQAVPFVEARVGCLFADSQTDRRGLGQDFNFTFTVSPGVQYFLSNNWSISLAAMYQHISNGGLSEPARANNSIDSIGPIFNASYHF